MERQKQAAYEAQKRLAASQPFPPPAQTSPPPPLPKTSFGPLSQVPLWKGLRTVPPPPPSPPMPNPFKKLKSIGGCVCGSSIINDVSI